LKYLFEHGCDINQEDVSKVSPFWIAAQEGLCLFLSFCFENKET